MARIKGQTVILHTEVLKEKDPFGKSIMTTTPIEVENVIIAPSSADDITTSINLTGRKAVYTLGIPKEDTHDWENKVIEFFGYKWKSFGIPLQGQEELIPLSWNKKVMVERYE